MTDRSTADQILRDHYAPILQAQLDGNGPLVRRMAEESAAREAARTPEERLGRKIQELEDRLETAIAVLRGEHECGDW